MSNWNDQRLELLIQTFTRSSPMLEPSRTCSTPSSSVTMWTQWKLDSSILIVAPCKENPGCASTLICIRHFGWNLSVSKEESVSLVMSISCFSCVCSWDAGMTLLIMMNVTSMELSLLLMFWSNSMNVSSSTSICLTFTIWEALSNEKGEF